MKLLVADDEDMIRNGIVNYVRSHTDRFEAVITASNGQEAIDLIYEKRPEILCLDVQMPIKTGLQVMEEANRAGILPYTIILSGYDEFQYCQKAMRMGAKDYLLKPVRSSDFLKMLVDHSICTRTEILNYLDYFISMKKKRKTDIYNDAIARWEYDRDFVSNYRADKLRKLQVGSITNKWNNQNNQKKRKKRKKR